MNRHDRAWSRLTAAARKAPVENETEVPYGFAVRVAARWVRTRPGARTAWERLTFRALGLACVLMVVSLAVNRSALVEMSVPDELALVDPVGELLRLR